MTQEKIFIEITKEMIDYYSDHLLSELKEKFNLNKSDYIIKNSLLNAGVKLHTQKENLFLSNKKQKEKIRNDEKDFIDKLDKEEFISYYNTHLDENTIDKYKIKNKQYLYRILDELHIKKHNNGVLMHYIDKYGIENGTKLYKEKRYNDAKRLLLSKEAIEKKEKTNLKKYGGKTPFASKQIHDDIKNTLIKKYGVDNVSKVKSVVEKIKNTSIKNHGGVGFASEELREKYNKIMQEKYGVDWGCQLQQCINSCNGNNSFANKLFENKLLENNIQYEKEFVIDNFRFDFKVSNTLIEIDPIATHNVNWNPFSKQTKITKNYHKDKTKKALDNGFKCIHIWEWDDIDKIIYLLKEHQKIYGRNCFVEEIDSKETKEFILKYHLQNNVNSKINIALKHKDEIVSIMTFGKPRYNKNYEYELLRYCSSQNVIGGAEKLFTYFLKNYKPQSIISYCDLSKFTGDVYKKLNFQSVGNAEPSKHWYNIKTKKHITDNLLRQRGFDQLFGTNYGKGTSNDELMLEHGFLCLYDCGQQTYIYSQGV